MQAPAVLGALLATGLLLVGTGAGEEAGAGAAPSPRSPEVEWLVEAGRAALPQLLKRAASSLKFDPDDKGPRELVTSATRELLEGRVSADSLLEKLREAIYEGLDEIRLPPLDPLTLPHLGDITVPLGERSTLLVVPRDTEVVGFGGFDGTLDVAVHLKPLAVVLAVELQWPHITLSSGYYARTNNAAINFWGNGTLGLILKDLGLNANISVELGGKKASVHLPSFSLTIKDVLVSISGLYGGGLLSEIVSHILNIFIQALKEALKEELPEATGELLRQTAETLLGDVPVQELRSLVEAITSSPLQ